ncbi:MAG TPA: bifunctional riboflavin kinase/FAD synthetase [Gemmatimonadaceae bacterium]|nr:bifunctional riboflavin kinase/FAD synthetase [Gemmatimonadaceae bacterium]
MTERFAGWADSGLPPASPGTVVTVGTFDGVHRGHELVCARLAAHAERSGLSGVLITFEPHPLEIVNPSAAPPLITLWPEKLEVLAETGIDYAAVLPFTSTLARYTAAQFVDEVLRRRFHVRHLIIGYDHGFGRGREGDVEVLQALGAERGFGVEVVEPVCDAGGHPISSTMIRRAVAGGDLRRAAIGLGRPYSVSGRVVPGAGRGRTLGYPTINLGPPPARKLLPPQGVYAVRVQTPAGPFGGMMNLGPRPTFGDAQPALEVHLFDVSRDLYDAPVRVEFVARLRDTRRFDSPAALAAQLATDERDARHELTRLGAATNMKDSTPMASS